MSARDDILRAIRSSLHRDAPTPARRAEIRRRLQEPVPGIVPARGRLPHDERVELFLTMAQEMAATVATIGDVGQLPAAVAAYLGDHDLPRRIVVAPGLADAADWTGAGLEARFGRAEADDVVAVTPAFAGVAETGTLVLLSGPASPTTLTFLPDTHVAFVRAADVAGTYEEVWARIRLLPDGLPRTVNMVTGPSRTADIEQTIQLGAHGPRRLHVVLLDDRGPRAS